MNAPKLERLELPLKTFVNGDQQTLKVFRLRGQNPGPIVYLQASVHGAEVQGNVVIWEIMDFLSKVSFNGSLTLVPMANPQALLHKSGTYTQGRFNPVSGNNWNRNYTDITKSNHFSLEEFSAKFGHDSPDKIKKHFKEYLYQALKNETKELKARGPQEDRHHNLILQELAAPADIILDLHTGPIATRYLYAGEFEREKVKDLNFPHTLIIPNEFAGAMDEACFMPWVSLREYLSNQGVSFSIPIESYTVELGSEEVIDTSEAKKDAAKILGLLAKRGLFDEENLGEDQKAFLREGLPAYQKACLLKDYKTYYAPQGGLTEYMKRPGDFFLKDDILCQTLSFRDLKAVEDLKECYSEVRAQSDGIVINHNPSAVTQEGNTLYQVMTEVFEL